ncbi:MAG: prolipoprotein diacylglyceryl transferase [Verrucomicrobia bacterium]|nr:prolipoprotein diacylglyceryl transferase [Verrucomicrobiota bacterium]MCH8514598.1 prolipoprotein diacylglyceryl transferase [Kiritimatiellia bacterium]
MHYIHRIRPEIIQFTETLAIRWYGLSYLVGFVIGYFILVRLSRANKLAIPADRIQDFLTALALFGVMLGGRLGYFLFYQPEKFFSDPGSFFRLWEGGMASHGGMIGCALVVLWWARKYQTTFWNIMDNLVVAGTPGLALGRVANFINGELWGHPTQKPWGVVFPLERGEFGPGGQLEAQRYDLDLLRQYVERGWLEPRHPSQLYQALLEGFLLFVVLFLLRRSPWSEAKAGRLSITFLIGYGLARFSMEFFREPDFGARVFFGWMSTGQFLTLFMFALAGVMIGFPKFFKRA